MSSRLPVHASHVNSGTSVPRNELVWPSGTGRVVRNPKLHVEVDHRTAVTGFGGAHLFLEFWKRFGVAGIVDKKVEVLSQHVPYHESDHVFAHSLNLFCGGECIEDMADLQNSEAVLRMSGACRLPDPTTGGDYLRRFRHCENPGSLEDLRSAGDEVQEKVWKTLRRKVGCTRRKRPWAIVDLDGHMKEVYGAQKQGADFSYKGKWSYNILLASLAGVGEVLALDAIPGSRRVLVPAADMLRRSLPRVKRHHRNVLVRADSEFDSQEIRRACEESNAYFAFVGREFSNRPKLAQKIQEKHWKPFTPRARRQCQQRCRRPGVRRRRKKRNLRKRQARRKNFKDLQLVRQWVAEIPYKASGSAKTYRLIIRRQLMEHRQGQTYLFDEYRYRYVITNLPKSLTASQVVDLTYQRCDQENVIEQMGNGLAAWRMPTGQLEANCAWLEMARLAWNIGKWIAQLALPAEVVRWKWKRFRRAFVYVPAHVIKQGRQVRVRISGSHRFHQTLVNAHVLLQT